MGIRWEIRFGPDVAKRLREAARTLTWLNMPKNGLPAAYRCNMPNTLPGTEWDVWNQLTPEQRQDLANYFNRQQLQPTAAQILRAFEAIEWLYFYFPSGRYNRDRRAIMAVAVGKSYRGVARFDGRHHNTIKRLWMRSCDLIAESL